jgi:hypothetical protein
MKRILLFIIFGCYTLLGFTQQSLLVPFKGGARSIEGLMNEQLRYPLQGLKNGIQTNVEVLFYVNEVGKTYHVWVRDQKGWGFDEEAIRLIRQLPPDWLSSVRNSTLHNLTLQFRCSDGKGRVYITKYLKVDHKRNLTRES